MRASFLNAFYNDAERIASALMNGTCLDLIGCRRLFNAKKFIIIGYGGILGLVIPRGGLASAHFLQRGVTCRALGIIEWLAFTGTACSAEIPAFKFEFPKREVEFSNNLSNH